LRDSTRFRQSFASRAPAPAFRWASALPESERNQQVLRDVVRTWAIWEPMAASRAVAGLAAGPQWERVRAALLESVAEQEDAELAQRVAEVLGIGEAR
jgi:hypothetical protein